MPRLRQFATIRHDDDTDFAAADRAAVQPGHQDPGMQPRTHDAPGHEHVPRGLRPQVRMCLQQRGVLVQTSKRRGDHIAAVSVYSAVLHSKVL